MTRREAKPRIVRLGPGLSSLADIYTELHRALDFPAYFGGNLDALWDAMRDVPGPVEIQWRQSARGRLGADFDALLRLFRDLERERPDFRLVLED
jgi:ribonuclease inhibitor